MYDLLMGSTLLGGAIARIAVCVAQLLFPLNP
jgi:hypothetical protein